jgi:hypothetical protein
MKLMAGGGHIGWGGGWGSFLATFLGCGPFEKNAAPAEGERRMDLFLSRCGRETAIFSRENMSVGAALRCFSLSRRISTSRRHSTAFLISSRA